MNALLLACLSGSALALAAAGAELQPRTPTPPVKAGPNDCFVDTTQASGLDFLHQLYHRRIANILLSNGAGAAVLDYDDDGWMDLYLLNGCPLEGVTDVPPGTPRQPNRLYRNRGDGTFEDVTRMAGVEGRGFCYAAAAGDYDNDGFTDLYIANAGRNLLYRNRGDGTFEEIGAATGVDDAHTGISAVFLDMDQDGWLDLFVANYLTYIPEKQSEQNPGAYPGPLAYAGEANVLFRNRGDGTFEDCTRSSGIFVPGHRAMSVSAFDANHDGHTDLYISNDDTPNMLWLNDGAGHFKEVGTDAGVAFNSIGEAPGSMNATIGDANGDGLFDLFVTRLGYGSLYLRQEKGFYEDHMWASGLGRLTQKYVGWGGAFIDYDNDADLDLAIGNGDAFTLEGTLPLLLENQGAAKFANAASKGGQCFATRFNVRGNAIVDYDNDGRLDLLFTTLADRPVLLHNQIPPTPHWLKVQLEGTRGNRNGFGAQLKLEAGGLVLCAEALCPTGFLTQGDDRVHFGLGACKQIDRLEIRWPGGSRQIVNQPAVDQILRIREPQS